MVAIFMAQAQGPTFSSNVTGATAEGRQPWPQLKGGRMSYIDNISPSDLEMIRAVLDDAGYDANLLVEDQRLFNTAALLVTKLFLSGVGSRSELAAKLACQLGKAGKHRQSCRSSLSRYAIQGLPLELQSRPRLQ